MFTKNGCSPCLLHQGGGQENDPYVLLIVQNPFVHLMRNLRAARLIALGSAVMKIAKQEDYWRSCSHRSHHI